MEAAARSYSTCPVALSADLHVPAFFWRVPLAEAEERFARREWGVYCGGNAWHLVQLLTAGGVEAFTYDFGPRGRSHVIALARVSGELIATDPYLGHYLAGEDGRPVPLRLQLEALRFDASGNLPGRWLPLPGVGRKTLLVRDAVTIARPAAPWLCTGELLVTGMADGRLVLEHEPPPPHAQFIAPTLDAQAAVEAGQDLLRPSTIADGTGQSTAVHEGEAASPGAARTKVLHELGFRPTHGAEREGG